MTKAPIMPRAPRMIGARGILSDTEGHSDARLTIFNHSPVSNTEERPQAAELLPSLQPQTQPKQKEITP